MTTVQIIALVTVGLLFLSSFVDLKEIFSKFSQKPTIVTPPPIVLPSKQPSLSDVVAQWEKLRNMCIEVGATKSVEELDNVFLYLLNKDLK